MTRLYVICEGQTEEAFVNELLQPWLAKKQIYVIPSLIGKPGHKGGNFKFERLYTDVRNYLQSDKSCYCTTFCDFYGLPSSFPGKQEALSQNSIERKATVVIAAMQRTIEEKLGENAARRFIPFVQMHEFEALLFSEPQAFAKGIGRSDLADSFTNIAQAFESPEHINNSPQTALSKRIEELLPGYEKPLMGGLGALEIGLSTMRAKCSLFNRWVTSLEDLAL